MKFTKKFIALLVIVFLGVIPVVALNADSGGPVVPGSTAAKGGTLLKNPLGGTATVPDLIQKVLTGALKIGIPIIALALIYAGFLFVFAMGNEKKLEKAKYALLYTLIGAAILLGSWAIATLISSTVRSLG